MQKKEETRDRKPVPESGASHRASTKRPGQGGRLSGLTREMFDSVMAVNLWAPVRLCPLSRASMQERGGGTIISMVSNEGIRPMPGLGSTRPRKRRWISVTTMLAKEWAKDGIRAVSIAPGLVRTELAAELVKAVEAQNIQLNPLGVIGERADIAALALVAASPAGRSLTAATLVVDGGEINAGPLWLGVTSSERRSCVSARPVVETP